MRLSDLHDKSLSTFNIESRDVERVLTRRDLNYIEAFAQLFSLLVVDGTGHIQDRRLVIQEISSLYETLLVASGGFRTIDRIFGAILRIGSCALII